MRLEELKVYQLAEQIADNVWQICVRWDLFARDTVGKQLVRAADSIAANIAEGFGRYSFKENKQFCFYARGSFEETRNWLRRAAKRGLLTDNEIKTLQPLMSEFPKLLNGYIKSIGPKSDTSTIESGN